MELLPEIPEFALAGFHIPFNVVPCQRAPRDLEMSR